MNHQRIPGRIIAGKLVKQVDPAKHRLRYLDAYAIAAAQLDDAERQGVREVELIEKGGDVLRASISTIRERGRRVQFGAFESQLALPVALWSRHSPAQGELFGGAE